MKKISMRMFMLMLLMVTTFVLVSCKETPVIDPTIYEVTFDADNGTTPVVVEVEDGEVAVKPANPTKVGYTFDQWELNGTTYVFSTPVVADITLVASYTEVVVVPPVEYTVSFDAVGANPIGSQTIETGEVAIKPADPEKTSFSFESWMLEDMVYDFSTPVTSDIQLSAKYAFVGIPDSPSYDGRVFNSDFDQIINDFTSATLNDTLEQMATIDSDQPYYSIGYSGAIGNNPDGALWKQAGSQNNESAAFQYLVLRLRGFEGASINDLAIGFRLDDNHEVLVVPLAETYDPDLQNNVRELDGDWHNYVISITDTLDGKEYVGKTGYTNVAAAGVLVGFHLLNINENGSGILDLKDAYYSKVPNPIYPFEGSDYSQNRDYWFGSIGMQVGTDVVVEPTGFYGEYLDADVNALNTHLVLRLRQASAGILNTSDLSIVPIFENGNEGTEVSLADVLEIPETLGSAWRNVTIAFADIYDGVDVIAGYKLINNSNINVAISKSFLSYLGDYEAVNYPVLDIENASIFDNFNRLAIGTTTAYTTDNQVAIDNGFTYLISYSDILASTIADGAITFDSTGGDYVSYKVHSTTKANQNEFRYLVLKYKLNDTGSLDNLRMAQLDYNDQNSAVIYANQWQAGLGLPSIPEDMSTYPYVDGEWTYLVVDLLLTEGYSTDFAGFDLYYTGSSISFDAIFFANQVTDLDESSEFVWATFEGLTLGTAQDQISDNQWWANVYDSPTTIVADGDSNQALQLDGTGYAQYHTAFKTTGRYLALDLKIATPGTLLSFRVGPTGAPLWAKDGQLILENGTPMVVNADGQWHHYVIDWVASGLAPTDTIGFHASDGEIYLIDNLAWFNENPYYDQSLLWGTWDGLLEGDANAQVGSDQYWSANYGTPSTFIDVDGNMMLKLDASTAYAQYHTGVAAKPDFISFDITVEAAGSLGVALGGVHRWNAELIGLDGNPIVLPGVGESGRIVIDVALSGLTPSDEFVIQANDGAIFLIDQLAFDWNDMTSDLYPILEEDFEATPVNDGSKYWWGEWALVSGGVVNLVTAEYAGLRFGSPLIAGGDYISFDVKLADGDNADEFRLELGDGNIVNWTTLVADGVVSNVGADFMRVTISLNDYLADVNGLQVIGFHINAGGVVIDNLIVYQDVYGYQVGLLVQ